MVSIREIFNTCVRHNHGENMDNFRLTLELIWSLVRAYYRTGQLDERDWFFGGMSFHTGFLDYEAVPPLHPLTVQHFYRRILPTLSEYDLLQMYLYRFNAQRTDAMILATGRFPSDIEFKTTLLHLRMKDENIAGDYVEAGFNPALAHSRYYRRVGAEMVDVTDEMAALPDETPLSAVVRPLYPLEPYRENEPPAQCAMILLSPEEEVLAGAAMQALDEPNHQHKSMIPYAELPEEPPAITPERVRAVWRQVLADDRYLANAYIQIRAHQFRHFDPGVNVTHLLLARFTSTLPEVTTHPVPIVAAAVRYLQLLLAHGGSTLRPEQVVDGDPVFGVVRSSTGWDLGLDRSTMGGLEHLMSGYAGEVPTDAVIQQRLIAL